MKYSCKYILSFLIFVYSFSTVSGQEFIDQYIHMPNEELNVEQVLQIIEKKIDNKLTYSSDIIENKKIKFKADSLTIRELIDTLFSKHNINFILKDNLYILSPQLNKNINNQQFKVTGKVINAKNKKSVPYAAVFIPNESTGTISNIEGVFELTIPANTVVDTLMISSLGYKQKKVPAWKFYSGPIEVSLDPDQYLIEELIVRPENPTKLILSAIERKSENYGEKPVLLTAFFREATQQDNNYISLSEAIIDIYKTSYTSENEDLIKLKKGRKGSNIEESELVNLIVEGGLYNNIQLDIVKYGAEFLEPEFFSNYIYKIERQISYRDRQTYIIDFKFKKNISHAGFDGKIYIDAKSLAIVHAEFEISQSGLKYARKNIIKKSPVGYWVRPLLGQYEVDYRIYDEKWHLMHAQSEIGVKVKKERGKKNKGFACNFTSTSEFVITGAATDNFERIKYKEASKPNDILMQQITDTDLEFWGNENVILPEEPLLKTIEKLSQQNKGDNLLSTKPSNKSKE